MVQSFAIKKLASDLMSGFVKARSSFIQGSQAFGLDSLVLDWDS